MSKFLKFIVHFAVICTIVCVLGLALPPFFGVRTVIMDSTDKATNLPLGSVTYAIPVRTEEVTAGSPILVQEDGKTYKYNLVSVNKENNTGTVIDTTTSAQESITVSVKNWVPKIVITIPFVGYLLVATESVEGLIVLGLVILFLIILYVIAELWRKDPEDDAYISFNFVSEGLIDAAGIKLLDGTDIDPAKKNNKGGAGILINETLAKRMGRPCRRTNRSVA